VKNPRHELSENSAAALDRAAEALMDAESDLLTAKYREDEQSANYADGRILTLKIRIARLDPYGAGSVYLNCLSSDERRKLGVD
jgi:hypothetical protein